MKRLQRSLLAALAMGLLSFPAEAPAAQGFEPEADDQKVSWHGYGELHFNIPKTGGTGFPDGNNPAQMDFHRMVWGLSYRFNDWIRLHTEVDFEHAAKEIELEFAYLDFLLHPAFSLRAGSMLMPVGPLNEFHEPTLYYSIERPYVETFIIPTTWMEGGMGAFGSLPGGWRYRIYGVSTLDATKFSASSGIRGGRGKVGSAPSEDLAVVGRLEFFGLPGFEAGGSFYWGGADNATKDKDLGSAAVRILEGDLRLRRAGFDLRGVIVHVDVTSADSIGAVTGSTIGDEMLGWYLEGAYNFWLLVAPDSGQSLVGFVRYEDFNTQESVPGGFTADPKNDRQVITGGIAYYPISDVAVKVGVEIWEDGTDATASRFNLGLAYQF